MTHPIELYTDPDRDDIAVGKAFAEVVKRTRSHKEASRLLGVPVSSLSNHIGLLRLPDDLQQAVSNRTITFKEGRALAKLQNKPRMRLIAKPFIDGSMSSNNVEQVIKLAINNPHWQLKDIEETLNGTTQPAKPVEWEPPQPAESLTVTSQEVRRAAFDLMGRLQMWQTDSTVDTLLAKQALKKLQPVIESAAG